MNKILPQKQNKKERKNPINFGDHNFNFNFLKVVFINHSQFNHCKTFRCEREISYYSMYRND